MELQDHITPIVKQIIADRLNISVLSVKDSSRLVNDLGADSLEVVEIAMDIEEKYNISLNDVLIEKAETVSDLITYVKSVWEDKCNNTSLSSLRNSL